MKSLIFTLSLAVGTVFAVEHPRVEITKERGTYVLNFDATYVMPIQSDNETAITLPDGYEFNTFMPGSVDFVSAGKLENTIYLSKPNFDNIRTNITLHVTTPEGLVKKLFFDLKSTPGSPRILGVHFVKQNTSELDRAVEAMRARFEAQLAAKLADQEAALKKSVQEQTLVESSPLFFNCDRGDLVAEYKGAKVLFDGVITTGTSSYVYLRSTVKLDQCDVVKLMGVKIKDNYNSKADLLATQDAGSGQTRYIYRIMALPLKKKTKVQFNLQIWSKDFTIKHKIS